VNQADLLRHVIDLLDGLDVTYMVVGSIASGSYGEPRMTRDIDIVIKLLFEDIPALCRAFPGPDYYVSEDAVMQAVRNGGQFNVIHSLSGNKIDFMIARGGPWGRMQISRRRRVQMLPGLEGYAAAPEDIILGKMEYYREGGSEKHLRDITGILKISGDGVDAAYIEDWAEKLGLTEIWQAIGRRLDPNGETGV